MDILQILIVKSGTKGTGKIEMALADMVPMRNLKMENLGRMGRSVSLL